MNTQDIKDSKNLNAPSKGNVPALRFPEFTDEWKKIRLGDNCSIQMCKRIMAAQTNTEGGVPFYKIGTIGGKADAYISKDLFDEYKRKYSYPNKGEVMITCAGTVGKCIIYDGEDSYYQDSNIVWIDNPNEIISNDFLYHLLSNINWSYLNSTTIVRIYNDDLRNLKLCCPRLDEQKKIARFLSLINERIATQNRIIEKYKSLIKAMCDTFIERETQQVTLSFSDFGQSYSGLSGKSAEDFGDGYPFITYMNVYQNQIIVSTDMGLVKIKAREQQSVVRHGDILLTLSSETPEEVGMGAVYFGKTYPLYLNSFCFGIHITDESMIYPPFLAYYVSSQLFRKAVYPLAQGSTRFNLQKSDFMKKKFSFPLIEKQRQIYSILNAYSNKLIVEKQIMRLLCNQKCHLLRQLFI